MIRDRKRSIPDVIKELDLKAEVSKNGKSGTEVLVDKGLLIQASAYLRDYLLEKMSEV